MSSLSILEYLQAMDSAILCGFAQLVESSLGLVEVCPLNTHSPTTLWGSDEVQVPLQDCAEEDSSLHLGIWVETPESLQLFLLPSGSDPTTVYLSPI